jgi:hypothetical protein
MTASILLQVPTAEGRCRVGEQTTNPINLKWRQGQPAPKNVALILGGTAVVHGSTAYFSEYSYTISGNKWITLPKCKYQFFALAVVIDTLTTVGGRDGSGTATNALLSLSGSSWEEILPPMPTKRKHPGTAVTPTHLVVAGGEPKPWNSLATVEILNTNTLQWSTASSLPVATSFPRITTHDGCLYFSPKNNNAFSCSVEDLLKSTNSNDVWTRLPRIPASRCSSLVTLKGRVLAIGGKAIHCYDVATNSWSVVGKMPTPRSEALTAVLPGNELVVVGGLQTNKFCSITEICSC